MILVLPLPGVRNVEQNTNFGWRRETTRVNRITVFVCYDQHASQSVVIFTVTGKYSAATAVAASVEASPWRANLNLAPGLAPMPDSQRAHAKIALDRAIDLDSACLWLTRLSPVRRLKARRVELDVCESLSPF